MAAAEALRDSARPAMGMVTRTVERCVDSLLPQAGALVAHEYGVGPGGEVYGGDWGGVPVGHGGVEPVAPLPQQAAQPLGGGFRSQPHPEGRPHGGPQRLGGQGVTAIPQQVHLVHAQGLGSAQHRAQVPRVLELLQHQAGAAV